MPTKLISKALLGVLSATILAAPAFAGGNCFGGSCNTGVQIVPGYAPEFGPMTVRTENPMGHLRSVNFQRAPNVSITRIHSMAPTAGLSDAPSGFTGGCNPTSTAYCRQSVGVPVNVQLAAPTPQPMIAPQPFIAPAPVFQAQIPAAPRTVRIGGGYDASKFTPRTYGDASLVPGVAYLPTSKVVRDPAAAQQVLDSGQTRPQDVVVPGTGTAPNLGMITGQTMNGGVNMPGTFIGAQMAPRMMMAPPATRFMGQPSAPVLQQSGPMAGNFASPVGRDGTYWEKVSGPTTFGSTVATSVICKRKLPTRVVNPVVGVPVAVPTPVQQGCATVQRPAGRYGQNAPGRWIQ